MSEWCLTCPATLLCATTPWHIMYCSTCNVYTVTYRAVVTPQRGEAWVQVSFITNAVIACHKRGDYPEGYYSGLIRCWPCFLAETWDFHISLATRAVLLGRR
jgi:hypothetical protein